MIPIRVRAFSEFSVDSQRNPGDAQKMSIHHDELPHLIRSADMTARSSRIRLAIGRLLRHALVHGLMPTVNFFNERAYVQYRPDCHAGRFKEIVRLQKTWERVNRGNNRGDYARLYFLMANIDALEQNGLPGAFAELGVYKGSTAKIMHHLAPRRDLYLFDTFEGFPDQHARADPRRLHGGGYACSLDEVRRFVGESRRVKYCKGIFPETAAMVPTDQHFALVHLDCDLYIPTKAALDFFYPRMVPGGIMILHDYYNGCWPGVVQAADEFLFDKPEGLIRIPDKSGTAALVRLRQQAPWV